MKYWYSTSTPPHRAGRFAAAALTLLLTAASGSGVASAQEPVVNAVLFYSPTCPHCHAVINQHLPPLRERFGDQFAVVGVDVTTPGGSSLYEAAVEYYGLSPDRLGVPLMVVGDVTLLGSQEIPEQLPGLIEEGLAGGGTPWPTLPALREALAAQGLFSVDASAPPPDVPTTTPPHGDAAPLTTSMAAEDLVRPTALQRFLQDPVANGVAVGVLLALLATLTVGLRGLRSTASPLPAFPRGAIPVLATVGLAIAGYLATVEVTGAAAVCGPVGDCNTVQRSEFAVLFGIPVGVLGGVGYLGIAAAWALSSFGPARSRVSARHGLWGMAFLGTAFSAYLTFLEPFVIGATCAWCIASALLMAGLLLASTREVQRAS